MYYQQMLVPHIIIALFHLVPMTFAIIVRRKDTGNGAAQPDLTGQTTRASNMFNSPIMVQCNLIHSDLLLPMLPRMIVLCLCKWILPLRSRLWLMSACNNYFWLPPLVLLLRWPLPLSLWFCHDHLWSFKYT